MSPAASFTPTMLGTSRASLSIVSWAILRPGAHRDVVEQHRQRRWPPATARKWAASPAWEGRL